MSETPKWPPCRCDMRTRLVGDGCDVCNPERAAKLAEPTCTCPSGDGSLRWPCPAHPPAAPDALEEAMRLADQYAGSMRGTWNSDEFREALRTFLAAHLRAPGEAEDAARWAWVRAENSRHPEGRWFAYPDPMKLDAAIDAARGKEGGEG